MNGDQRLKLDVVDSVDLESTWKDTGDPWAGKSCPHANSESHWTDCGTEHDAWCGGYTSETAADVCFERCCWQGPDQCRLYQITVLGKRHPE